MDKKLNRKQIGYQFTWRHAISQYIKFLGSLSYKCIYAAKSSAFYFGLHAIILIGINIA